MSSVIIAAGEETALNPFLPADYDIIWSLVVFVVIAAFFGFYAIPRFRKILDDRAAVIEGGIAKAENAQAEAAAQLEKYNQLLAEGRAEAAEIREKSRAEGAAILAELKAEAQAESARILANAQTQIEAERQAALVSLRAEVGTLAIDLASRVVGETLSDDQKAAGLVDRFLADLETSESAKA